MCCPLKIYRQHPLPCAVHSLCPTTYTLLLWMEGQGIGRAHLHFSKQYYKHSLRQCPQVIKIFNFSEWLRKHKKQTNKQKNTPHPTSRPFYTGRIYICKRVKTCIFSVPSANCRITTQQQSMPKGVCISCWLRHSLIILHDYFISYI